MLQEMMLGEEYQMLSGTGTAITQPGAPTVVTRAAGSNETAFASNSAASPVWIAVTALTYFGQTAYSTSSVASVASASWNSSVADVTIPAVRGAYAYNVYIAASATAPAAANMALYASVVGG